VPEGAAEFTVGDRPKADVFLPADDCRDRAVFSFFQFGRRDLVFLAPRARFFQRRCAQETSHMIGAEGGSCTFGHLYPDVIFVRRPGERQRGRDPSSAVYREGTAYESPLFAGTTASITSPRPRPPARRSSAAL